MIPQSAQLALPFSMKDAVSVRRASGILGVSPNTIYRMMDDHVIEYIQRGREGTILIRYSSLVEYCDGLRVTFNLPNRRPPLSNPIFRHSDRDIPPFPLDQNMSVEEVMRVLQLEKSRVIKMANDQDLEAYQLTPGSVWRFYRPSVEKLVATIWACAQKRPSPRYRGWGI